MPIYFYLEGQIRSLLMSKACLSIPIIRQVNRLRLVKSYLSPKCCSCRRGHGKFLHLFYKDSRVCRIPINKNSILWSPTCYFYEAKLTAIWPESNTRMRSYDKMVLNRSIISVYVSLSMMRFFSLVGIDLRAMQIKVLSLNSVCMVFWIFESVSKSTDALYVKQVVYKWIKIKIKIGLNSKHN